jgi:hypothetical protein
MTKAHFFKYFVAGQKWLKQFCDLWRYHVDVVSKIIRFSEFLVQNQLVEVYHDSITKAAYFRGQAHSEWFNQKVFLLLFVLHDFVQTKLSVDRKSLVVRKTVLCLVHRKTSAEVR